MKHDLHPRMKVQILRDLGYSQRKISEMIGKGRKFV